MILSRDFTIHEKLELPNFHDLYGEITFVFDMD